MKVKRLLITALIIGVAVGAGLLFTSSFFSDTETSAGNKFVAGKFNLQVGSQCTYNGQTQENCNWLTPRDLTNELFFNLADVKPGDFGENTLSLKVDNNDAWICAELYNLKNFDNGCEKPESLIDQSCGTPGENQGELQNNLFFTVWKDLNCNNILDQGETKIVDNASVSAALWPIADSSTGTPIKGGTTACYGFSWNVPLATSNIIQSDSVEADVKFTAVQARHMENFTCSGLFTEVCDGKDNNYNNQIDEGPLWTNKGQPCTVGVGACQSSGTYICDSQNPAGPTVCSATAGTPGAETCNGLDDNCNGQVDEGDPGGGGICKTGGVGVCLMGTNHCQNGAIVCTQNVNPSPEVCDGIDNNCDGQVDEGNPGGGIACNTGKPGVCAAGTSQCQNGALVCTQNVSSSPETCDGLDNNCNGIVDEGNPGGGAVCSTGKPGVCASGTIQCAAGALACIPNVSSSPEVCDGLDNNCDGQVDEGNPGGGGTCTTGLQGVCSTGTVQCTSGALHCNQNVLPSSEICDGKDNDCDGQTDENGASICNDGLYCNGAESCTAGVCTHAGNPCPGPNGNNNCSESCNETSDNCTAADPNGSACTLAHANGSCTGGICSNPSCSQNYANCDNNPANGCEVNFATDVNNCGVCGNLCSSNHGVAACVSSACTISCNPGYGNCNGNASDGCEALLPTFYRDADGDGYGNPSVTTQACIAPAGYVSNGTDCNDANATIHPGATEVCDGLDNDCDGAVDESIPDGDICWVGQMGAHAYWTCSGGGWQCIH